MKFDCMLSGRRTARRGGGGGGGLEEAFRLASDAMRCHHGPLPASISCLRHSRHSAPKAPSAAAKRSAPMLVVAKKRTA